MDSKAIRNCIGLVYSVEINKSPSTIFQFLSEIDKHYLALSSGHSHCEISNGGTLRLGAKMKCSERAGNQSVSHLFEVIEMEKDKTIVLFSERSRGRVNKREFENSTYVIQTLQIADKNLTKLTTEVLIVMPNKIVKFLAIVTGTRRIWMNHLIEETENVKRILTI